MGPWSRAVHSSRPRLFTSLRDIPFWIRSARTDSLLRRLRKKHGNAQAFNRLYRICGDPWLSTVPHYRYQPLKYRSVLSVLPQRNYRRALDIGCGLGTFSRALAERCGEVLGIDISQCAVDCARRDCSAIGNLQFRQADLLELDAGSLGEFDLVVLADTFYYLPDLSAHGLQAAREQVLKTIAPGGTLLLVNHYFFRFDSHSRTTRAIHDCFLSANGMRLKSEHRRPFYLVSLFERNPRITCRTGKLSLFQ